jgi:hypothetical protein
LPLLVPAVKPPFEKRNKPEVNGLPSGLNVVKIISSEPGKIPIPPNAFV